MTVRLGSLDLGPVPRIAVPLSDLELGAHGERARRLADVVELRIDQFDARAPAAVAATVRAARQLGMPLIATVRDAAEGGAVALDDEQRLALFEAVAAQVDALDVELRASICTRVVALAKRHRKLAIVSHPCAPWRAAPPRAASRSASTPAATKRSRWR